MKKAEVKKGKKKNVLKEYWPLYLMMLPALLYPDGRYGDCV